MPRDPRVSYGVALLIRDGTKVLLLKRKGAHAPGHWACPGGWVDFAETARDACVREAKEELGVEIEIDRFLTFREEAFLADPLQSLSLYFEAHIVKGVPAIQELEKCAELRWVDLRHPFPDPLFPHLASVLVEVAHAHFGITPDPVESLPEVQSLRRRILDNWDPRHPRWRDEGAQEWLAHDIDQLIHRVALLASLTCRVT